MWCPSLLPSPALLSLPRKSLDERFVHRPRPHRRRPVSALQLFSLSAFLCTAPSLSAQTVIATDGDVPSTMDAGGSEGNNAQYIVGNTGAYNGFSSADSVNLGSANDYNEFIVRNGSEFDMDDFEVITLGSDHNTITVTGANSELLVHYHSSGIVSTGTGDSDNTVNVLDGGFFQMGDFNIGSNSTGNTLNVDGADSKFQTRYTVNVAGGGELATTISNGGLVTVANYSAVDDNLVMTINDGGTLILRSAQDLNEFSTFTINSGGTLNAYNTLSNLAAITDGQTIDLTRLVSSVNTTTGSFGTATTLNGGTLRTVDYDYTGANLTFTSGTHEASGALSNVPAIEANMTVDLTPGGSFATNTTLDGGTVATDTFDYTGANLTFTSGTHEASGALSNVPDIEANMTVDLTPGGSFATSTTLDGGTAATSTFDYTGGNLTFTTGTHEASGALSNVPDIEANMTVDISDGGSFATSTTLDGGTVATDTFDYTGGNLTFTSGTHEASGALSNVPTVASGMTVDISDDGSFATATTLDGGTAAVADFNLATDNLTFTSGTLDTSGTLTVGSDNSTQTLSGTITGSGSLAKSGSGTLTLTGSNDYTGGTTIDVGTLAATNANLGTGTVTLDGGTLSTTTYDATNLSVTSGTLTASGTLTNLPTIAANFTVDLTAGGDFGDATTLNGGTAAVGDFNLATDNLTFTSGTLDTSGTLTIGSDDSSATLSGTITGSGSLTKSGTGTATLTGTNDYAGGTTISAGTLAATNANLGSGTVTLDGGTLTTTTYDATDLSVTSGTLVASGTLTNLPTIAANFTVDLTSGGDFGDATTLNGGTVATGFFDYSIGNLTFTAGTHEASGGIANAPSITAGMTFDLTPGGTFLTPTLLNGGTVASGEFDFASDNLVFIAGTHQASGTLTNIPHITTGMTIDLTSGGSFATATTLNGGTVQAGNLDFNTLAFPAGTVEATGTVSNLPGLDPGTSLILNGGSWTDSVDLGLGGNLTLLNGATFANSASFFVAGNITFTSGTLTVAGILAGLEALASTDQTVVLDGANASWTPLGNIESGNVRLADGGTLNVGNYEATNFDLSSHGNLTASGILSNLLAIEDDLTVALTPTGTLGSPAVLAGGTLAVTGNVFDLSNLVFDHGTVEVDAAIVAPGSLAPLVSPSGPQTVSLANASIWEVGPVAIDNVNLSIDGGSVLALLGTSYDASLLTFTSGRIDLFDSQLTNLNTLGTDQTVAMVGPTATWSPTGDIDSGSVTLTDGTLSVTDYDATNLTFGSGTLAASGTLTNLPTIASNDIVDLTPGGSFGDTTTLDGGTVKVSDFDYTNGNLNFEDGTLDVAGTLTAGTGDTSDAISGDITGTGDLIKTGSGTLTLSGTNTYSGGTTVSAGTLSLATDQAAGTGAIATTGSVIDYADGVTIANAIDLQSDSTQLQVTTGSATQSGVIGETGGSRPLEKIGDGTLVLTGTNTYTGGTTISDGTLEGDSSSLQGDITNNAALVFDQSTDGTYAGVISGSGSLTKTGAGTLDLDGTNTYSGDITVSDGILNSKSPSTFAPNADDATSLTIATGGALYVYGQSLLGQADNSSVTADIYGTFAADNIYIGSATSAASDITVHAGGSLSTGGGAYLGLDNGSTLHVGDGGAAPTISVFIINNDTGTGYLDFNHTDTDFHLHQSDRTSISGNIAVTHRGSGTTYLGIGQIGGDHTYTGGTTLSAGTLVISGTSSLGASSGEVTFDGGTLRSDATFATDHPTTLAAAGGTFEIDDATTLTWEGDITGSGSLVKTGTGTLELDGSNDYSGSTTISAGTLSGTTSSLPGDITNNAALTFDQDSDGSFTHIISGSGSLTKSGTGTVTLSGANTYSGGTTVAAGTLAVSSNALLGESSGSLIFDGGTLQTTASFTADRATTVDFGGGTLDVNDATTLSWEGTISGTGDLIKTGSGTLTLSGTNTYSGGTTVSAGTLSLATDQAAGTGAIATTGSVIDYADGVTIANAIDLQSDSTQLQVTTGSATQSGVIGETGGSRPLEKIGDGTLVLTGTNTYTGGTTISDGTLEGDSSSLQGDITNNAALVFDQSTDGTYAGVISGSGSLTKTGAGTLDLDGTNTYSGDITVSDGILNSKSPSTFAPNADDATSLTIATGGALYVYGQSLLGQADNSSVTADIYGTFAADNIYIGSATSAASDITVHAGGSLSTGGGAYLGLDNGSTLHVGDGGAAPTISVFIINNDTGTGYLDFNHTDTDFHLHQSDRTSISGNIAVTHRGSGTTYLGIGQIGGDHTYTGGTTLSAGTLVISGTSSLGASSGEVTFDGGTLRSDATFATDHPTTLAAAGGTFEIDDATTLTWEGGITGSGSLVKTSTGILELTGSNDYSGSTTINAGTLSGGSTDTLSPNSTFTLADASGALLDLNDFDQTIGGLSGGGSTGGNVDLGSATLTVNNSDSTSFDGVISGSGSLTKSGSAILSLSGTNTYSGGTTISDGTLSATTANLGSGAITIDGGTLSTTTFDGTGNTFSSGGLTASGSVTNLPTIGSGMTVDLSSGGSFGDATTLDGGSVASGEFDYSTGNLTFTSGTHQLSGALTNLDSLGANQTVILDGSSATWSPSGDIDTGSVTLQSNAKLTVTDYDASNLTFTDGDLTVTGSLTGLDSLSASQQDVFLEGGSWAPSGNIDAGDVTIDDGGTLTVNDFDPTNLTFTNGTLAVNGELSGPGRVYLANQTLDLSGGGTLPTDATNILLLGGTLRVADMDFNPTDAAVPVAVLASSRIEATGTITNLEDFQYSANAASGDTVLDGGSWTTTADIDAFNLTLQNGGQLTVADYDGTKLTFTDGSLTATGTLTNLPTIAANHTVDISGGGSFGDASTLDGGTLQTAAFDMANLTFTTGTLETSGALTNLNSLSASQTVNINGGSWSPSGDIDAGNVILHNTGQLTVGDFDASNLIGVSGDDANPASTLTTTGTLTNIDHDADLNIDVVLDGGTWADSSVTADFATTLQNGGSLTAAADYDASNLTFTNGTLTTTGALTNLHTLGSGNTVVLDGGSWSPTGNIDSGSLTLQNAAALTIGDYDASNLTFTSGSITTDGALTNLNTLNANHTVTIDGSGASWSPTGNIDAGTVNLTEGSLTLNTNFDASNLTFASTFSEPVALLTMNSGSLTNLNTLQVGQRITLNGSSSWAPTGNIETGETVLNSTNATLTTTGDLDTRAVVFNAGTLVGDGVLSELPTIGSNMTVDLSSGGSLGTATTLDGGDLITADFDATLLTATRGDLTASGAVSNLGTIGSNLDVDLRNGGSLATATTLSGGELFVDDFDATHLSLSSGEIYASGDVSNLPTIGGNVYVNMSSDAAFTTATTLDGGEVGFDSVPGIFDFSTSNLTFTSGSLYFYDEGIANLPDITSGQTVYLADAGFATSTTLNGGDLVLEGTIDYNDLELTFTTGTLTVGFEGELANLPAITANQTVDITEGGFITTTFLAGGTLITEDFDENDEVLFAFGTLQASGAVHDLGSIISGQTVDISNGGSIEDLTTLAGGSLKVDDIDFDEDPVNFTAGTVVALGNVYLEDDLESGMILDITAGGELGGGADIIGGTLKTVDFDADGPSPTDFYEGTLSVTGELTGLHGLDGPDEGEGQSVILDGGTWSPDRGESDSDYINDGNVTIQNDGLLIVNGNYDATNLTFTNGTLALTNEAELENLDTLGAGQTVVLDDAFWMAAGDINAGNIEITNGGFLVANSGDGASTEFDATNLTFTSGALAVEDQDLVNLNTVGTYQTVYLDNGAWSPTGSIDNADEIGLYNNASLTVGDYDASNLDFDSGTVTTTGSLTNLDTLGADNAVVIDGGEWLPTGGDISAGTVTVQNDGLLGIGTDFSTGTYDASNLTLTSGTLSSNHDITNLDTLGAGATVELFADADWSPAGNIDAGTVKLNGGTLNVGDYDATNLPLSFDGADAGGTLVTTGTLTNLNALNDGLNVTLDGGTWATTGDIDAGSVTVQNDGNLGVADYDASNLTLTTGTVTATGSLTQLNSLASTDQTIVLDGGTWSPTGSVGAGNVTLQNDGTLNVGDYDATRLILTAGTVASDGSLTNLPTITTGNTIDVTLGGTIDNATTLAGGTIDATQLDATNVTFTSGTINMAGGPLTNLNTLGTNQTVTLDNASWSTTGDINNGNVTLTNNASLTVADYDTANLTFTSGTVEATGTLTHNQQLADNQTVRLNGGSATYDVGIDLQLSAGTIELANGGTLDVGSHTATVLDADTISFDSTGGAIALDGGTLNLASLDGPFGLDANASITGNGSIFGDVGLGVGGTLDGDATGLEVFGHVSGTGTLNDVTLFGNLTIGNSPGDIYLENTTLSASTIVTLAIEGPDLGQFDRLFVDATSDVSAATLNITFDNYTPSSVGLTFNLVSNSSSTSFATVNTPDGWSLSNGILSASAVPEPHTFAFLAGLLSLGFTATRRRTRK